MLVGSSAGAAIAGTALDSVPSARAYVGIGYTFGRLSSWVFGSHYTNIIKSVKPKLFIMGTNDEFTTVSQLNDKLANTKSVRVELMEGVGHFALETPKYASAIADYVCKFIEMVEKG